MRAIHGKTIARRARAAAMLILALVLLTTLTRALGSLGRGGARARPRGDARDDESEIFGNELHGELEGRDYAHEDVRARARAEDVGGAEVEAEANEEAEAETNAEAEAKEDLNELPVATTPSRSGWEEDFKMRDPPRVVNGALIGDAHPKWMREMWSARTEAVSESARVEIEAKLEGVPDALKHIKPGEQLFVTFGTASVKDFVFNWVAATKALALEPIFVGALDEEMFELCKGAKIPSMLLTGRSILEARNSEFIAQGSESFKKMGTVKTKFVEDLLEIGIAPILSDADVVWMRDPRPVFNNGTYKYADILISTDCIDTIADRADSGSCNHVNFNTGILHVRPTPHAKTFVRDWKNLVTTSTIAWMRDQPAFNILTRDGGIHQAVEVPLDKRGMAGYRSLVYVANATIRMGVLPNYQFSNGHTYFVQEHQKYHPEDGKPYAVHTTYQYGDSSAYAYGKRERLRQHGLWYVDPKSYWTGKFLTVSTKGSQVKFEGPSAIGLEPDAYFTAITRHFEEDKLRRVTIRNALALAKALGRILILPEARCYCDKIWNTLKGCRALGAETGHLPYACPMDHIYDLPAWFKNLDVDFREPGFLNDERVSGKIREDVVYVKVGADDGTKTADVTIAPGFNAQTIVNALSAFSSSAVIEFDHLGDGTFCGFGNDAENDEFDAQTKEALSSAQYFCFDEAYSKQGRPNNGQSGHGEYEPQVVNRHCGRSEASMHSVITPGVVSHITQEPITCSCEWAYGAPKSLKKTSCLTVA